MTYALGRRIRWRHAGHPHIVRTRENDYRTSAFRWPW